MKFIKVFLIFVFLGVFPFSCCGPNEDGPYDLVLREVYLYKELRTNSFGNFLHENEVYNKDSLMMYLGLYPKPIAEVSLNINFIPTATALSCPDPVYKNLNDKIKRISVTSDTIFNNVLTSSNLSNKIIFFNHRTKTNFGLEGFIERFNTQEGSNVFEESTLKMYLTEKPSSRQRHKFKVTIEYESGRKDVAQTPRIIWQ